MKGTAEEMVHNAACGTEIKDGRRKEVRRPRDRSEKARLILLASRGGGSREVAIIEQVAANNFFRITLKN